jgi:pre-mRNA-splicing factor RBM22/SLT11
MTEKGFGIVNEVNKNGWEESSFPVLCETCLGDNPYVRMLKENFGKECKICQRPFTVFKWKPGAKARYKTTIVCQVCSRLKNVCQTCLFDLEYGLPVQVRDKFLAEHERIDLPTSQVNKDFFINQMQDKMGDASLPYGKESSRNPMLERLKRSGPYYKRNAPRICSFFVKGECTRGADCPFRHEMPEGGELADQNIKDRFHGENDPVARKIFRIADEKMTLQPPEDKDITSLYLGGISAEISEQDIRGTMYVYGAILSIKMVPQRACAFVIFQDREAAEKAASALGSRVTINGKSMRMNWSKPQGGKGAGQVLEGSQLPQQQAGTGQFGAVGQTIGFTPYYPSMDPRAVGNAPLAHEEMGKGSGQAPPSDLPTGKGGKGPKGKGAPPMAPMVPMMQMMKGKGAPMMGFGGMPAPPQ